MMLHATVTLGERKYREHCILPSSLVENGTEAGSQKFSAFGFMNQKLNVVCSVFKHVKESVCTSNHLFCVSLET
jgi:hypothetical protein